MEVKFDKINKLSSKVVLILSLFFSIIVVVSNFALIGKDVVEGKTKYIFLALIIVLIISTLGLYISKVKNNKYFLVILFLLSFITRIIWISIVSTEPVSDFFIMYDAAINIVEGNKEVLIDNLYFSSWVYQLGFTTYLVMLYKIFNGSLFFIKLVNVFIVSFIPIVIYKIVEKIISERSARIVSVFYSLYFSSIAYTSTLTNQHLSTLLCYIAIYLLLTRFHKRWIFIIVGILIGIGHIIRPEGTLLLISIILFMIFKNKILDRNYLNNLLKTAGITIVFFIVVKVFSIFLISSGITQYKFGNRNTLWKFVEGLNYESGGSYSEEDNELLYYIPAGEKNEIELELIKDRLSNPKQVIVLFAKKVVTFWGADDNSFNFIYTDSEVYYKYNNISVAVEKVQYFIIVIFFMLGTRRLYKQKKFSDMHLFLIIFLGYVFAYMIIEIQIRYRYFIMPLLLIVAAYEIENFMLRRECIKSKDNMI